VIETQQGALSVCGELGLGSVGAEQALTCRSGGKVGLQILGFGTLDQRQELSECHGHLSWRGDQRRLGGDGAGGWLDLVDLRDRYVLAVVLLIFETVSAESGSDRA
jgi:hypothetical protein